MESIGRMPRSLSGRVPEGDMPDLSSDSHIEVYLNADRTQAFANFHPPQPVNASAAAAQLTERLHRLGVAYGIRKEKIEGAIRQVVETSLPQMAVLVAEGTLPIPGDDARLEWLVPESMVNDPL